MRAIAKQQARARYTMRAREEVSREEDPLLPPAKMNPSVYKALRKVFKNICLRACADSFRLQYFRNFTIYRKSIIVEARPNKVFLSDPSPRSRMRVVPFYFNAWYIKEKVYGPQGRASSQKDIERKTSNVNSL